MKRKFNNVTSPEAKVLIHKRTSLVGFWFACKPSKGEREFTLQLSFGLKRLVRSARGWPLVFMRNLMRSQRYPVFVWSRSIML